MKKSISISMADFNKAAKSASDAILTAEGTVSNRLRTLQEYAKTGTDISGFALPYVVEFASLCAKAKLDIQQLKIYDILNAYPVRAFNEKGESRPAVKVNIFEIYDDCTFKMRKTENGKHKGQDKYEKIKEFVVFDMKQTWTILDIMQSIKNIIKEDVPTTFYREVPYIQNGKSLKESRKASHVLRATDAERAREAEVRNPKSEE